MKQFIKPETQLPNPPLTLRTMPLNKIDCLSHGSVELLDHMGSDASVCDDARISYGNHMRLLPVEVAVSKVIERDVRVIAHLFEEGIHTFIIEGDTPNLVLHHERDADKLRQIMVEQDTFTEDNFKKDFNLIRYLMRNFHTSPFEMVSFKFLIKAPIFVVRQWHRHRTWSYNEYSMRYKEPTMEFETTSPGSWRLQSTDNKQGSSGFLEDWPEGYDELTQDSFPSAGAQMTAMEEMEHERSVKLYKERMDFGIAKEQARKDLPLSTYTEFVAKVDLHNLFHFLRLRMHPHAQQEIRVYANAIASLIEGIVPMSYEAFEDYRLNACSLSHQERMIVNSIFQNLERREINNLLEHFGTKMSEREKTEFITKMTEEL
jgi:thymidylate synthase (FAD)